jgi:ketosteroid isomerase-like protein
MSENNDSPSVKRWQDYIPLIIIIAPALLAFCLIAFATSASGAAPEDTAPVLTVVDGFHDALRRGDEKAAMELLAPDAVILENGYAETRAEYERGHLREDIAFAREVQSIRSVSSSRREGDIAWVVSTSRTTGSFHTRKIDSIGTELMVLSRAGDGWRICAIHWSSRKIPGKP